MKEVIWEDRDGYKYRSLLRDTDSDHLAASGVPLGYPDLSILDWDGIKRDLHNVLCERRLHTWQDVLENQGEFMSSILSVMKRPLVGLYRQQANAAKNGGT